MSTYKPEALFADFTISVQEHHVNRTPWQAPAMKMWWRLSEALRQAIPTAKIDSTELLKQFFGDKDPCTSDTLHKRYPEARACIRKKHGVDISDLCPGLPLDADGNLLHPSQLVGSQACPFEEAKPSKAVFPEFVPDLLGCSRPGKPYLDEVTTVMRNPRCSDPFAIKGKGERKRAVRDLMNCVNSESGRLAFWLFETESPTDVLRHLAATGIKWPENLLPLFTVTRDNADTRRQMEALRQIPAQERGVIWSPLEEFTDPRLFDGIGWLIVQASTDAGAPPIRLDFVEEVWGGAGIQDCERVLFVNNLGPRVFLYGTEIHFADPIGADIKEWPADFRERQLPLNLQYYRCDEYEEEYDEKPAEEDADLLAVC